MKPAPSRLWQVQILQDGLENPSKLEKPTGDYALQLESNKKIIVWGSIAMVKRCQQVLKLEERY